MSKYKKPYLLKCETTIKLNHYMNKKIITIIPFILLTACSINEITSELSTTQNETTSESISSSIDNQTSTNGGKTTSTTNVSTSTIEDDDWFNGRIKLDCGYYAMDLPKNSDSPEELKTTLSADANSWSNNDLTSSIPDGFRYIYRNSCDDGIINHKTSPSFYSETAGGGIKITRSGVGIQSRMFTHNGAKLEIRIGIGCVNNASDTPEKNKEPLHVYFFDKVGDYIGKYAFEVGSINAKSENNELKFYWTENAQNVAYFDVRCNARPYKNSQVYNFAIKSINYKSWERI